MAIHSIISTLAFSGTTHPPSPTPVRRNNVLVEQDFRRHWKPFTAVRISGFSSRSSSEFPVPVYSESQVLQLGQLGRISNPDLPRLGWCWNPSRRGRAPQGIATPLTPLDSLISMLRPVDRRGACPQIVRIPLFLPAPPLNTPKIRKYASAAHAGYSPKQCPASRQNLVLCMPTSYLMYCAHNLSR